jgi:hypothetical protein
MMMDRRNVMLSCYFWTAVAAHRMPSILVRPRHIPRSRRLTMSFLPSRALEVLVVRSMRTAFVSLHLAGRKLQ